MKCARCGTDNNEKFVFCTRCGAALAQRRCASCQAFLIPGDTFCRSCGKPIVSGQPPAPPGFQQAPPASTAATAGTARTGVKPNLIRKWLLAAVALVLIAALIWSYVLIFLLPSGNGSKRGGGLTLGAAHHLTDAAVGPEGGTISVEDGALGGLTIDVPENAYESDTDFSVSMTEIKSDQFGDAFTAASPLITVDNGEVFSNAPIFVTVPIVKTDDEFALGFYYDRETGELEGLPLVTETNSKIVIMTRHFSEIVISKVPKGRIVDKADSDFRPGTDDMQVDNCGSVAAPGGYCAGQCLAELYYFCSKGRVGWEKPLYGLYDNNGKGKTPDLWQDDSFEIRLCSAVQDAYNRGNAGAALKEYYAYEGKDDTLTFNAFAYAITLTGKPSLIRMSSKSEETFGHAMIVYKATKDGLFLADPNATTSDKPFLALTREKGKTPKFEPYVSAANASDLAGGKTIDFDKFGYYGMFAMVDREVIGGFWQQLKSGKDPGAGLFPADTKLEVAVDMDGDGKITATALKDGLVLNGPGMDNLGTSGSSGTFICRVNSTDPKVRLTLFAGTNEQELSSDWKKTPRVELRKGSNDYGILEERRQSDGKYSYVNFRRFKVLYGDSESGPPSPEPSLEAETDETVPPSPSFEDEPDEASPSALTDALSGDWAGTLKVKETSGGSFQDAYMDDLFDIFNHTPYDWDGEFGFSIYLEGGGKHVIEWPANHMNNNVISVSGASVTITRADRETGTTLTLTGTLSPDGTVLSGSFTWTFGTGGADYYKGTWKAHNTA